MSGQLYYWVANWGLSRASAARLLGNNVADMIDCTHSALPEVRKCYPSIKRFAGYTTGSPDIRWTPEDFNGIPRDCRVLSIDQSDADIPVLSDVKFAVKDDESGASTIGVSVEVARQRLGHGDDYTVYCAQSWLGELETAMGHAGLHGKIVGYQFASPTSDPGMIVPGTGRTLRELNADLSVVETAWLPLPAPPVVNATADRTWRAEVTIDGKAGVVEVDPDTRTWLPGVGQQHVSVRPLPYGTT